ncbi:MAG: sensor histidine kinase, partial [Actinobacteria bacterium]|nr:sensor histidine kinase [Actinomycetota bacterium]
PLGLERAVEQVERLERTIETLLAVARDVPRPDAACELVGVLGEVEMRWRGRLAAAGRRLNVRAPAAPVAAGAARVVVDEILDVLLDNALTHGAGAVELTLGAVEPEWVTIEIADEGQGFAEPVEAAFARRSGRGEGHGIGLALARSLAHAEGGRLSVGAGGPSPVLTLTLPRKGS